MKDLLGLMGKAKEMQAKFQPMQEEIAEMEATGQAGGGLVMSRDRQVRDEVPEDRPVAVQGGRGRDPRGPDPCRPQGCQVQGRAAMKEKTAALTAGLPIPPGFKLPF